MAKEEQMRVVTYVVQEFQTKFNIIALQSAEKSQTLIIRIVQNLEKVRNGLGCVGCTDGAPP